MKKLIALFIKLMNQPEWNSRFIFLISGLASTLAVVVLTIAFLFAKDRGSYPSMVMAVASGGGVAALGRAATKFTGQGKADSDATSDT